MIIKAWPTQYKKITQLFGARPWYYEKFGLPGHEGLDFRSKFGEIYSCSDGKVTLVGTRFEKDPYGIQVRILTTYNRAIYEFIYAHLSKYEVKVGDKILAGQLIGYGGNTGNSTAAHLHLTLKQIGAQTEYPNGIIDPTSHFNEFLAPKTIKDYL